MQLPEGVVLAVEPELVIVAITASATTSELTEGDEATEGEEATEAPAEA